MDLLLDHDCLIFNRSDLIEEQVLRLHSAEKFTKRYLGMTMSEKITVYRILDSERERFNIRGPFANKIDNIINVITAPEIEMLVIHAEDCYIDYD